jgi:ribosomal protein L11 methyltransferase
LSEAKFTLTIGGLSHAEAFAMMEQIEERFALDPIAVTINETDEVHALWETVAWFADEAETGAARIALGLADAVIAPVPQRDWVGESLAGLNPVIAGRFFLHGSHDRGLRHAGGIALEIDAGTAFGTGHHGTTTGCLLALDEILKRRCPRNTLDLGTGTGVLGLAAAIAVKRSVLATDIDAEAVRVAKLNAIRNRAGPLLHGVAAPGLHHPVFRAHAPFDLIFANILARPLAHLAQGLSGLLAPHGALILSGLTLDQERWIRACYRAHGLHPTRIIYCGNWVTLVLTKPSRQKKTRLFKNKRDYETKASTTARGPGWEFDI